MERPAPYILQKADLLPHCWDMPLGVLWWGCHPAKTQPEAHLPGTVLSALPWPSPAPGAEPGSASLPPATGFGTQIEEKINMTLWHIGKFSLQQEGLPFTPGIAFRGEGVVPWTHQGLFLGQLVGGGIAKRPQTLSCLCKNVGCRISSFPRPLPSCQRRLSQLTPISANHCTDSWGGSVPSSTVAPPLPINLHLCKLLCRLLVCG